MRKTATEKPHTLVSTGASFIALSIAVVVFMTALADSVDLSAVQAVKITVAYIIMGGMVLVRS